MLVAIAYSIGVICGIAILVITCLRPKRMYVFVSYIIIYTTIERYEISLSRLAFPTVLIIYMVITLLVLGEGTKQ